MLNDRVHPIRTLSEGEPYVILVPTNAAARRINAALLPSYRFANSDESVFSMSIKAMLRTLGQPVGDCRLPLPPTPPGVEAEARRVWAALQATAP